jgi:signal peptidase II
MFHFDKTITWNGNTIELFPPVFNVADSAITVGIIIILLFQKRFFENLDKSKEEKASDETTITINHEA